MFNSLLLFQKSNPKLRQVLDLKFIIIIILFTFNSCKKEENVLTNSQVNHAIQPFWAAQTFDLQAHRGGAGLFPENTIPAFLNAVSLGINTLELDVCVSKDKQVIVTHDLSFNSSFVSKPDGTPLLKAEAANLVFYQMLYNDIKQYDVGVRKNPSFPSAKLIKANIPLLSEVIQKCENYVIEKTMKPVIYNIEIKTGVKGKSQPSTIQEYWDLVQNELIEIAPQKVIIQCFDVATLNYIQQHNPYGFRISYLSSVGNAEGQLKKINFKPDIYSPLYSVVNKEDVAFCHKNNIKVIPWTVDSKSVFSKLKDSLKVDGIITNYPNFFM